MEKLPINLNSSRLQLRPIKMEDCGEHYLSWLNDETINQFLETRWYPQNLQTIKAFVTQMQADTNNHLLAIVERSANTHIGNIKLGPINRQHNHAEISYFIGDRAYWGQGLATEAVSLLADFALSQLEIRYLLAGVYASNIASIKVLEKSGFIQQGRFEKQLLNARGEREDHLWFGRW